MGRAPCCDKANVKKGPWSPEEDAKLKAYIEENGTGGNWIALPQKIGLKRCGKSCRLRWLNYLRPNIKHGGFSEEEDQIICSLYISIGSRWSIIAAQLPGRTDNDIKNYWNTRLKKKLLGRRRESSSKTRQHGPNSGPSDAADFDNSPQPPPSQTLSSTALERMQLHLQLQGLHINHPSFSFYNHPALWPAKLHPLVEATKLQQDNEGAINGTTTPLVQPLAQPSDTNVPCYPPMSGNPNPNGFNELEGELKELIYGKNNRVLSELDCFNQGMINGEGGEGLNWWDSNGFVVDEKSPSCSWDSGASSSLHPADYSLLNQEYVLGYDL